MFGHNSINQKVLMAEIDRHPKHLNMLHLNLYSIFNQYNYLPYKKLIIRDLKGMRVDSIGVENDIFKVSLVT